MSVIPVKDSFLSPWAPLQHKVFRVLWVASIVSNIGTWMHEVGAGWLMTSLAPSPLMVALVQAATSAPVFLLALPAGALADIVDRRRYLIASQIWMMAAAALLGVLTLAGVTTAPILLILTFALGIGTAMMMPAWGAITPELVQRSELHAAIGLNSIGMNVSRSVGPAIAGFIVAAAGPGVVFILNAISFLAVIAALKSWHSTPVASELPAERVVGAIRAGLRYARHSPELRAVLTRGAAFFVFASASWALLPLVVRLELKSGPGTYGLFLACLGVGAIGGALLPRVRTRLSRDGIVAGATLFYAIAMLALAHSVSVYEAGAAMLLTGMAWISVVSSLMTAAQTALPGWVRARGLALFWVVFMGGMAAGSTLWGQIASWIGIPYALTAAALGALLGIAATWKYRIGQHDETDLTPSINWPTPLLADDPEADRGPVMVTVEYRIDPATAAEFSRIMHQQMRRIRRRDGAFMWELFNDIDQPDRIVECFMVESWFEHLRQHGRVTVADREVIEQTRKFHLGSKPPLVTHLVAGRN